MALDPVLLNPGIGGDSIGSDNIGGVNYEVVKQAFGAVGALILVEPAAPLPVTDAVAEAALASIAAEDFATQTTLAALLAKVIAAPSTEAKQDAMIALLTTIAAITQPLTDAQLRATAVAVSGTFFQATQPVSASNLDIRDLTFAADKVDASGSTGVGVTGTFFQATQPVSGPLTDAQLRATPVPVSGTVAVTGAGDATAANQTTQITAEQAAATSLAIMDDWDESDRAKVNVIAGQVGISGGTGTDGATVPRVTLATNVGLPAGTNLLGKTGIDQTTPGTTNLVALTAETSKVIGTVNVSVPTTIFNGKTSVTTAGTRVVLATTQAVKSVTIKALAANTGLIFVGNATVASTNGFQLSPGDSISMDVADLNTVNIDSAVNGEGVSYIGIN